MTVLELLPELKNKPEEYIKSVEKSYNDYIDFSDIPVGYRNEYRVNIIGKLENIMKNISTVVSDRYNILLNFNGYKNTGYIAYVIINEYFKQIHLNNDILENIVYIDTNLLVEDYKRLMNVNQLSQNTAHSLNTLLNSIETASMVIWDKFSKLESTYDKHKIYDILSIRKRNNCCNIYMIAGGTSNLSQVIGADIFDMMDVDFGCDCSRINFEVPKKGMNLEC